MGFLDQLTLKVWAISTALETQSMHNRQVSLNAVTRSEHSLVPLVFQPLPLGSIKPHGWLLDQMQLMSDGLAGHLYDFYYYVAGSSWLGGSHEYAALNEGFPYWFNGLVPLAYQLDDDRLKQQVHAATEYVLSKQQQDGWLGPETHPSQRILWARFPFCLGLMQLVDANSTYAATVVPALYKFTALMLEMLQDGYQGYQYRGDPGTRPVQFQWGRLRYADMLIVLQWLFEKYPDQGDSDDLFETMGLLDEGSLNWSSWYNGAVYIKDDLSKVPESRLRGKFPYSHAVNVGQGLKASAVIRRFTANNSLIGTAALSVNWTFQYHGAASGSVIGDERMAGLSPWTGSELCTAVETMYSLSYLYHALGDRDYADKCELAAFNALPVMLTPDHWAHQYIAQPNQPFSHHINPPPFFNTNGWSQTYGLEPHYPCCTVNHPQGFPKFLAQSWVTIVGNSNGIGHALLGPSSVNVTLGVGKVAITSTTDYPFSSSLSYTIDTPGPIDFYVRIPSWALKTSYSQINSSNQKTQLSPDSTSGMQHIPIKSAGVTSVTINLDAQINVTPRANDTVAVYYGALLYAIPINATITKLAPRHFKTSKPFPAGYAPKDSHDYIMTNASAWNLAIDPNTLKFQASDGSGNLPNPIFAPDAPPVQMTAQACEIHWPMLLEFDVPGPPIPLAQRECLGPAFQVTLAPYGSAKLHMAELPVINLSSDSALR